MTLGARSATSAATLGIVYVVDVPSDDSDLVSAPLARAVNVHSRRLSANVTCDTVRSGDAPDVRSVLSHLALP